MSNAVDIAFRNGYQTNFYKIKNDVFMEVVNREGIVIGSTKLTTDKVESLKDLID